MTSSEPLRTHWIFYRDSIVGKEIDQIQMAIVSLKIQLEKDPNNAALRNQIIDLESQIKGNLKYASTPGVYSNNQELEKRVDENANRLDENETRIIDTEKNQKIHDLLIAKKYEEVLELDSKNETANYGMFMKTYNGGQPSTETNSVKYYELAKPIILNKNCTYLLFPAFEYDLKGDTQKALNILGEIQSFIEKNPSQAFRFANPFDTKYNRGMRDKVSSEFREAMDNAIKKNNTIATDYRLRE